jgi:hypothetical protein
MIGLVDRVSVVRLGGNSPHRQVKISGQDMGKLLLKHDVGWDIEKFNLMIAKSGDSDKKDAYTQLNRQFDVSLTVKTAKDLVTQLFRDTFQAVLPKWASLFTLDADAVTEDWILWDPAIVNLQGCSIWAILTKVGHLPFNVLTTETRGTQEFLVTLEPQPIDNNGMLVRSPDRQRTIYETDIISDDVGVSDNERVNFLFYLPQFYLSAAGMSVPVAMAHPDLIQYYKPSIEIHGYCAKTFKDEFVPPSSNRDLGPPDTSAWLLQAKDATVLLWNWYQFNHTYWSGTFQIHLRPDIKAGDELRHDLGNGEIMQYQIEQVSHQYIVWPQPQFTTTLHVTRGQSL